MNAAAKAGDNRLILALDQGTTSSRAIIFDANTRVAALAQKEFPQHFPQSGWVEHDPEDLWQSSLETAREAVAKVGGAGRIAAIGITNQRETTLVWDRRTGEAVANAIVWQDRRTSALCSRLKEEGHEELFTSRTGLLLDPYFSGTKIAWILDNVEGAREKAEAGHLAFGTVDSWLIWRLTGGRVHATDATNASRTLVYDIHKGDWDDDLLGILAIPRSMLPEVKNSADDFGASDTEIFGAPIPISGVAGDQQAATVGQACFEAGMLKSTYGTGCFALLNTGTAPVRSTNRLLTTIAYKLNGKPAYALEGSIFVAGAAVQWLRDGLGMIGQAAESSALAAQADDAHRVYLVPAFTGLGAPYWDADARGAMYGLTRASGPADFARAALESVGYQTRDLLEAMHSDWSAGGKETVLRVDGGMVASDWAMQFLADILGAPVDRPVVAETTALGAAYLAGLRHDYYPEPVEMAAQWALERRFEPRMEPDFRDRLYAGWRDAIRRTVSG
ncbi:glycerol kinase GlpK [Nisaea acidiphila]|uniref:Glycerol kinase n=1 Tax=Nisaea acidiphila TaxID=1862145 RepID=A0A9J7AZE6_9PROT|nr:glycerol kinase GlpK [Nisaea acidiphila]UUX51628.1 glycerol kinase GlpK [Nisaea acidiphila]